MQEDRLQEMFDRQLILARNFIPVDKLISVGEVGDIERQKYLVTYVQLLIEEAVELQRTLPARKFWRKSVSSKPVNWRDAIEEMADIIHIVIAMCIIIGLSPQEMFEEYVRKNDINLERVKNNS